MCIKFTCSVILSLIYGLIIFISGDGNCETNSGICLEHIYTGEVFSNETKGIDGRRESEYRGLFDFLVSYETGDKSRWKGLSFLLHFQEGHGKGLTERVVGDYQWLSNIDDRSEFSQISEFIVSQSFAEGRAVLKIGKEDVSSDFNVVNSAVDFINSSFGLLPNVPMPTFPHQGLGISGLFNITDNMSFNAGFFDGESLGTRAGFDTMFDGGEEFFFIGEWCYSYLPENRGRIKAGFWQHGGRFILEREISTISRDEHFGVYFLMEQSIIAGGENKKSLDGFMQYSYAEDSISMFPHYFGAGLKLGGISAKRKNDNLGIAFATILVNSKVPKTRDETAVEFYYKFVLNDRITFQPDIQYIINPGGSDRKTLVSGLRFYIDFKSL